MQRFLAHFETFVDFVVNPLEQMILYKKLSRDRALIWLDYRRLG